MPSDGNVPRAARYVLKAPAICRRAPDGDWRAGETVDVSRSGVLLASDADWDVGDRLEIRLLLSASGSPVADIRASGKVVRIGRRLDGGRVEIATTIDDYRFERGDGDPPRRSPLGD
jgi:PilZ domain